MSPDMKTADIKTVDTKGIGKKKSRLSEVWRQLKKNKFAMVGMVVIILLVLVAIFAGYLAPYGFDESDFSASFAGPSAEHLLGCDKLVITNACGGVNLSLRVGDICLITDHIKFFMDSPLRGKNLDEFGTRFPDATHLYTPRLQDVARSVAKAQGLDLKEGVYMYFPGPSYETPAEIRAIRTLGADLVGMSTVPEVLAAGHAGMEVLGFSLVSNAAAGIVEGATLSEQEVLDAAAAAKERFSQLICDCVENM